MARAMGIPQGTLAAFGVSSLEGGRGGERREFPPPLWP